MRIAAYPESIREAGEPEPEPVAHKLEVAVA